MTTTHNAPGPTMSADSAGALKRLVDTELSMPARLGYVALLLAAVTITGVIATLWATEPALPPRTQVGFGLMIAIGLCWVAFALWVLTNRRILFARHRIIAGRMSVTFTTLFVLAALGLGHATNRPDAYKAAAVGGVMLAAAVAILIRAHRAFARLADRRDSLARELGRDRR